MGRCHGITQGHLGIFDDLVSPAECMVGVLLGEGGVDARMSIAWVPDCRRHVSEGT